MMCTFVVLTQWSKSIVQGQPKISPNLQTNYKINQLKTKQSTNIYRSLIRMLVSFGKCNMKFQTPPTFLKIIYKKLTVKSGAIS